jgi:hypothetical protein
MGTLIPIAISGAGILAGLLLALVVGGAAGWLLGGAIGVACVALGLNTAPAFTARDRASRMYRDL